MGVAVDELKAIDFTFLKRNPENQEYANGQKRNVNFFANPDKISLENKEANKQNLQETAQLLRSAQADKIPADMSNKMQGKIDGSRFLHRIISKLLGEDGELSAKLSYADPESVFATLLGVHFDGTGKDLKKDVLNNMNGNLGKVYEEYLTDVWNNAQDPNNKEIIGFLNMFPDLGPIALTCVLQDLGYNAPHIYGKDFGAFINSIVFAVKRTFNTFGATIVSAGENSINALKGAIGGTNVTIDNVLTNAYNNYKKIGTSIKDKGAEIGNRVRMLANLIIGNLEYC